MDCIVTTTIFLSVLKAALCFNIDPVAWKALSNSAAGFGHQVVQRRSDLLVSAPLSQYSPRGRGQIFKCSATSCSQLSVLLPEFAVNMSLGLTMTMDPVTQNTLACGPTIPKDCKSITMYNGVCVEIKPSNAAGNPVPSSIEECRIQADIAFLLDGSGSVHPAEFNRMKDFVSNLVTSFKREDTKFAVVQFSSRVDVHSDFSTFNEGNFENKIQQISQIKGGTKTAAAIQTVVDRIFSTKRGARPNMKRVLIVITDGESQDAKDLSGAAQSAEEKKIVRFAIGVGSAFSKEEAKQELDKIASSPPENHVFQVESFDALEKIRQNLQDRIFSIEGSQTGGESLKMEMSQEGFSAAYVPGGFQMAIVGAHQWKGGFVTYTSSGEKKSSYEAEHMEPDGYLGYSMAVAETPKGPLTIVGAPRYQHQGAVFTVQTNNQHQKIDPNPGQSGEYFGAEVCAMDLDRDTNTDLILISGPMYMDTDREGRVYVCRLSGLTVVCDSDPPLVLRGHASNRGRFGSSLAVLPDLNADGISDLAVGAPLENDGQGCIYIFHGEGRGGISLAYTQRITGSEVKSGLKFFGMSISQPSFDLSGDSLPDLAVGSKGSVVLLRSKPIVMVETKVSFSPKLIPTQNCSSPVKITAQICFIMTRHSTVDTAQARINFTFTLDATRKVPLNRAYISEKNRVEIRSINLDLKKQQCPDVNFFTVACPEDSLNALHNELRFTFEGLSSNTNLSPSLALHAQTKNNHPLGFEINCGKDNKCVDNLKVDFNFTSSLEVKVGIDELLDVTVSVENREENSYNSRVILTYPAGLSYRKFTTLQGRIECNSSDSEAGLSRGKTDCTIDKPIFKSNKKVFFIVSYGIKTNSRFDRRIFVTANATSGNQEHSSSSKLYDLKWIDVKYSILVTIESSLSYNNFTFGNDNLQKPVQQSITVTNDIRALNFTMVIKMPVQLGDKDIWADSNNLQLPGCQRDKDQEPTVKDFVAQIQKSKLVDCSVAKCSMFRCKMSMEKLQHKMYWISANLSSQWIQQIGLISAKFLLTGTASLEYDSNQYIFFSTGLNNNPPIRKIKVEVEVYSEPDLIKPIVGGSLGGLFLLALITAGLFKAGFFKSKYQEMITDNAGEAGGPGDGGEAPTPEPEA